MLSLADGVGWASVIAARVLLPPFTWVLGLLLCSLIQECGLSIIELSYLVKPSHFNMSMSVKTVGCFSNKIFNDTEFLMTMHVCEEELLHFLVFSTN